MHRSMRSVFEMQSGHARGISESKSTKMSTQAIFSAVLYFFQSKQLAPIYILLALLCLCHYITHLGQQQIQQGGELRQNFYNTFANCVIIQHKLYETAVKIAVSDKNTTTSRNIAKYYALFNDRTRCIRKTCDTLRRVCNSNKDIEYLLELLKMHFVRENYGNTTTLYKLKTETGDFTDALHYNYVYLVHNRTVYRPVEVKVINSDNNSTVKSSISSYYVDIGLRIVLHLFVLILVAIYNRI